MAYQTDDDGNIIYRSDDDGPRYRMVQTDDGWGKEYTTPEQEQAEAAQQQAQREAEAIAEQQRQRDAEAAAKAEKDRLYAAVKNANPEIAAFADRVLPFTQDTAVLCAGLHFPDPKPERDAMIAATALQHRMILVTRNTVDFENTGVALINPFADVAAAPLLS